LATDLFFGLTILEAGDHSALPFKSYRLHERRHAASEQLLPRNIKEKTLEKEEFRVMIVTE
jgi:hypothetical protein